MRACILDQSPRRARALPRQIASVLRISVWMYLARGIMHMAITEILEEMS
jgi:hypothetical protein